MAEENNSLSVSVAPDAYTTTVAVDANGAIGKAQTTGDSLKINTAEDAELEADLKATDEEDNGDGDVADTPAPDEPAADADGSDAEVASELPEYDPANEEVRSAYDAKYIHEVDGKAQLNLNAFNEEATAAYEKDGKPDINPGSRAWLKDTFGIDDAGIDTYLAGLQRSHEAKLDGLFALAGGPEAYSSMLDWARGEGGYTEEQRAKFNAEVSKGGEAAETAIALLKSRFERAGGKTPVQASKPKIGLRDRKPSKPARQANGNPPAAKTVEGFKDSEEHRIAMLEAGDDKAKVEAVRARLRASSWFGK